MFPRWGADLASINKGDAHTMVGRTELWLEAQRPSLPALPCVWSTNRPPARRLGAQLRASTRPARRQAGRSLVGEHLPGMIESWRRIPAHLRSEERAGAPPTQLADGLGKISAESTRSPANWPRATSMPSPCADAILTIAMAMGWKTPRRRHLWRTTQFVILETSKHARAPHPRQG
jgi:hypothetical protein